MNEVYVIAVLAVCGLAMGSFIDALTWRLRYQEKHKKSGKKYSILNGRSMCEHCKHQLGPIDLVPLMSWLSTSGKCRYCKHKIGWQVPAIEVFMGVLFVGLYLFFPVEVSGAENITWFVFWLVYSVALVAMAVYDIRWMLLPNRIVLPLIGVAVGHAVIQSIVFDGGTNHIKDTVIGLLIGGGIFYLLFQLSKGRWIGGGDVKLGFFIGLVLGALKSAIALWLSFAIASVIIFPLLLTRRITRKSRIPFGPFLIIATFIAFLWGQDIAEWYDRVFLNNAYY